MIERGNFGSRIGIILATAGSAVGLGNVWRFPYMTGHNGGAAFILIYLGCILMLGIPGMVSEFIVGRRSQANAFRAYANFSKGKGWGLVGILGIITSTIILGFYAVVAGWCLQYLFVSITGGIHGDVTYVKRYFEEFSSNAVLPTVLTVV
ncbi:MAG: sodium-dependent transporter, partial [Prevotella sp.]|nr:sodium-dependent transporter [Prevotella sp.]